MTLDIDFADLYKIIRSFEADSEGWIPISKFLIKASEVLSCTPLTIRNFVKKNSDHFDIRFGEIRIKSEVYSIEKQAADNEEYASWLKLRETLLNECLEFLKVQTPSPYLENLLVKIATVREGLSRYDDSQMQSLILDLGREYNFVPKTSLNISMEINSGSDKIETEVLPKGN